MSTLPLTLGIDVGFDGKDIVDVKERWNIVLDIGIDVDVDVDINVDVDGDAEFNMHS